MDDLGVDAARGATNVAKRIAENVACDSLRQGGKFIGNTTRDVLNNVLKTIKQDGTLNLEKIINSGKEISMIEVPKQDVKYFLDYAKKYKLPIAVIKEQEGERKLLFTKDFEPLIRNGAEELIRSKVNQQEKRPCILSKLNNIRDRMQALKMDNMVKEKVTSHER